MTNIRLNRFGLVVLGTAFLLQACEPSVPEYFQEVDVVATAAQATAVETTQACNSSTLQWMIGQPDVVVAGIEFVGPVRVIGVNQTMTMDYDPTRTNFYLDTDKRITRVTCG